MMETEELIQPFHLPPEIAEVVGTRDAGIVDTSVAPAIALVPDGSVEGNPLQSLAEVERAYINRILKAVGGNKTEAARVLGISRQTLRTKLAHDS
jgi:DNA-binding NtrC family response regulator